MTLPKLDLGGLWIMLSAVPGIGIGFLVESCLASKPVESEAFPLGLRCRHTIVIDMEPEVPWETRDHAALASAQTRCKFRYPASPCLAQFTRWEVGRYRAMCGKEEK